MLSIIVAKAKNDVIGKDNKMLWHLTDDMKRFKELTMNHPVIMGRKTFESIGKALPHRKNIILTKNPNFKVENGDIEIANSLADIKKYVESEENTFVIGGATIYNLLMPYTKVLYVTEINKDYDGDTFFAKIESKDWKEVSRKQGPKDEENSFSYDYVVYNRIGDIQTI